MYDFDKLTNRFNTESIKWNVEEDELPMWIADMDFDAAPCIKDAILERLNKPCFGYNLVPDEWYDAYINFWDRNYNFKIEKDWLMFSTGVVPTISSAVRRLTKPAEKVVVLTPVYNIFFNSIYNNGRYILECPLEYKNGTYTIDFDDLENKLSDPQTTLMILCNPHNPIGKIWSKSELAKIGRLCKMHDVTIISDEIHCSLTDPEKTYIPFASVNNVCRDISVTCISPTKAFSIPGLQTSAVFVPNKALRNKVYRGLNNDEIAEPNTFAVPVTIAAFTKGEDWLNEVRKYIYENKKIVYDFIGKKLYSCNAILQDSTYLMWIDVSNVCNDSKRLCDFIRANTGLILTPGVEYGSKGEGFVRMNVATQRNRVIDGLNRLNEAISLFIKNKWEGFLF